MQDSPNLAELSTKFSSTNILRVSSAATQDTGLPAKVEACAPGSQSIISAFATQAPSGNPAAMPFAIAITSGSMPQCSIANNLPVLPKPA